MLEIVLAGSIVSRLDYISAAGKLASPTNRLKKTKREIVFNKSRFPRARFHSRFIITIITGIGDNSIGEKYDGV